VIHPTSFKYSRIASAALAPSPAATAACSWWSLPASIRPSEHDLELTVEKLEVG